MGGTGYVELEQRPGSFYIGNMCALEHSVAHGATPITPGGIDDPDSQVEIAVMLRSDRFRDNRAR